jgi:probable HAF family extracellular repeat protein
MKFHVHLSILSALLCHPAALSAEPAPQFKIKDLGTLGGTTSDAAGINQAGHVSGRSTTAAGDLHGYFWTARTGMTDIGTLGGKLTFPTAINDRDQIVGYSQIGSNQPCIQASCNHAFIWTAKTGMVDLGTVDSKTFNIIPQSINNRGEVVGYFETFAQGPGIGHGIERPFIWTPKRGMVDLGTLPGDIAGFATAINDDGQVIGHSFNCALGVSCLGQAFVWNADEGIVGLGTLGGTSSSANAINDRGEITGVSDTTGGSHAFIWTHHFGMRDLGTLGSQSSGSAINGRGEIAGTYQSSVGQTRPFLWTHHRGMRDIGSLGGAFGSPSAINNAGEIVGASATTSANHAFHWTESAGMIDLGTLPNGTTSSAVAINEDHQIAGFSDGANGGSVHAVLWTQQCHRERCDNH